MRLDGELYGPDDATVRAPIPLMMRVAIVLYKLGSCGEYRLVANQFGIHKSTVKKFLYMFCKGMMAGPIRQLIRVPSDEEAVEIAGWFEAAHRIPQIMGIIELKETVFLLGKKQKNCLHFYENYLK